MKIVGLLCLCSLGIRLAVMGSCADVVLEDTAQLVSDSVAIHGEGACSLDDSGTGVA